MLTPYIESKRVKTFRMGIAKAIPKFPNNRATLETLEACSLASLLIHYNNWAIRYVSTRPRTISIESTASSDSRWSGLRSQISSFLEKVKNGEDLIPHLSLEPHTRGYSPASAIRGPETDKWADKDFLLNVMGYHHFHLGTTGQPDGFAVRTDDLLFARLSRKHLTVIAIFDHTVFKQTSNPTESMTNERERLWTVFDEHASREVAPDMVFIPSVITTSGHSLHLVRLASDYAHIVKEIDPQLDNAEFVKGLYETAGVPCPKKPKLKWHLKLLDLGLLDATSNSFFIFKHGAN